ncbi:uncharacterized protein LOC111710503 [Eurytemora carolleeae]|uniref:uncharacterized protein LOC111710503 n=1 Tax=Eurytemora carolleeae TaxID=1294199 RepID=UPI000C7697F4|nr:uncharacterized protein LOC111710503 [Eurytemora carolleeae]|eukprot:XP_023340374.1 uncharacterized protein LOC111710503 [Eurytemora affinis]
MATMADEIDIKEDEIDIKDEIEPLINSSSVSIKSGFKDEFSDELEAETEDQDTENDDLNDAEEIVTDGVSLDDEQQFVDDSELVGDADLLDETPDNDPLNMTEELEEDGLEDDEVLADDQDVDNTLEDEILENEEGDEDESMNAEDEPMTTEDEQKNGTKRKSPDDKSDVPVRKSSRIRLRTDLRKDQEENGQVKSVHDTQREKTKMLQKPTERPTRVNEDDEQSEGEKVSDTEKEEEPTVEDTSKGDRSRQPGVGASRKIDQDFLLPFRLGWTREASVRQVKAGPPQIDIFYWPPKDGEDHGARNREARRKRRSKVDQERYFEEFPHPQLSVNNFTYVRRPLELNNEAYEIVRYSKPSLETRSDKRTRAGKIASYKEVAEHEGLLSSNSSEDEAEEVQDITEFDQGLPLSLQVLSRVTPLREESKKRHKYPNRDRCVTPHLAEEISWTLLDDDPLGIYHELGGRSSPSTPPPLRALRLTSHPTIAAINQKLDEIRTGLVDPMLRITEGNKDLNMKDNLASHDAAIKKYKDFAPVVPFQHRSLHGRPVQRGIVGRVGAAGFRPPPSAARSSNTNSVGFVKVRLPMLSTNGKRPVVELVMLNNGKYQPIKFTNNRQVTESIPKRLFDQANSMRKTLYQRSVQVPKIGAKQVFIAINPSPGSRPFQSNTNGSPANRQPQKPQQQKPQQPQQQTSKPPSSSDQVSILVRPAQGGNAVLLNVPRHVALKVKIGTTLSFSASNEQKYTVIDNKMHPPVGKGRPPPPRQERKPAIHTIPSLPSGVSIRPINRTQNHQQQNRPQVGRTTPAGRAQQFVRQIQAQVRHSSPRPIQTAGRKSGPSVSNFSPCSPFCPGVTGIPELECSSCHSLFHPVCVGIPHNRIHLLASLFRCKACGSNGPGSGGGGGGSKSIQVIDLD